MTAKKRRQHDEPEIKEDVVDPDLDGGDPDFGMTADIEPDTPKTDKIVYGVSTAESSTASLPAMPISEPAAPALPRIALRVFMKIAGPKWDQMAGFKSHAKSKNMGPLTVAEWRAELDRYKNLPTLGR